MLNAARDEAEEVVATLVDPSEYVRHLNQVAGLSTRHIDFVARKFVSSSGYDLVRYPLTTCTKVKHFDERPALTIVSGVLLLGVIALVLYGLVSSWDDLEPGTRVPAGAVALAGLYGVRRVLGARRHRLVFTLSDKTKLTWKSRPGEYRYRKASADRIVQFARDRGILDTSLLSRA